MIREVKPGFFTRGKFISEHNRSYDALNDVFQLALEFYERLCFCYNKIIWLHPDFEVDLVTGQYANVDNPTVLITLDYVSFYLVRYKDREEGNRYMLVNQGLEYSNISRNWVCAGLNESEIVLKLAEIFYNFNSIKRRKIKKEKADPPYSLSKGVY